MKIRAILLAAHFHILVRSISDEYMMTNVISSAFIPATLQFSSFVFMFGRLAR